jgi:hypothetical protein
MVIENPYVFDEFLFANQSHVIYKDSVFALIHRCINTLAPLFGIFSAFLVVYLVLFQTSAHIRAFSRMLLLCAVTDLVYAFSDLWSQAVS